MKTIFALILAVATTAACADDCPAETSAAVSFMNAYLRYSNDRTVKQTNQSTARWLQASRLVSPRMKAAYVALQREGHRQDPELGWDVDLIVDAQDSPDAGFKFYSCNGPSLVELQGEDWPDFHVVVRVVRIKGKLLVDGAGRVNLPESQRAKR